MSSVAFKEWGVICEALARGRQTIILRKGGIHEGRAGFRVSHAQFWLLPTRFHAAPDALTTDALPLLAAAEDAAAEGVFRVQYFATVEQVIEIATEQHALTLAGLHVWSEATVRQRFHYKQPGLYCLVIRMSKSAVVHEVADTPQIAGCRSWVDLPHALSTEGLQPVIEDAAHAAMVEQVRDRLAVGG